MKTPLEHICPALMRLNAQLNLPRQIAADSVLPVEDYDELVRRTEANLHELAHHLVLARRDGPFTHGLPKLERSVDARINGLTTFSKDLNELETHALTIVLMREYGHVLRQKDLIQQTGWICNPKGYYRLLQTLLTENLILEIAARVKHHLDEEIARVQSEKKRR